MRRQGDRKRQGGQTALEFALVLPVFLLLVVGILDFSLLVWYRNVVAEAAREGTRYAIVHGTSVPVAEQASLAKVTTVVKGYGFGMDPSKIAVNATWSDGNAPGNPGSQVTVTVTYSHSPVTGLVIKRAAVTLSSSASAFIVY